MGDPLEGFTEKSGNFSPRPRLAGTAQKESLPPPPWQGKEIQKANAG